MNKIIKKIITIFIVIILTFNNVILCLNQSINKLIIDNYLKEEIQNLSLTGLIESDELKDNITMKKIKRHLDILYAITDIIDIPKEKVTTLIDSKISKDIVYKVILNIIDSIRNNEQEVLFNIDDYNSIVDDNLEIILKEKKINLSPKEEAILSKLLKEVGKNILKDIPTTKVILDDMSNNEKIFIRILINDNYSVIITINIILMLILFVINWNRNYFIKLSIVSGISASILFIINFVLHSLTYACDSEWQFMANLITYLKSSILFSATIFLVITFSLIFIYIAVKRNKLAK